MKLRYVLVGLCLLLLALPAFAQETAEWGDLGLEVEFSDDWEVDDSGEDALLVLFTDEMAIFFYEPWSDYDDAQEVADIIMDNEDFEFDDQVDIEILGEDAIQIPYTSEDYSGFSVVFEFEGEVLVLDALAVGDSLSNRDEDTLLEVVTTLRETGSSTPSGEGIESVLDEDATGDDIVEELVDLGLVEDGGDFLFEEDEVIDTEDLPESYEGGKIAMGALVSFERADDDEEYRVCGFIAQSSTDDMANDEGTLLITGLDSDSAFVTFELDIEDIEGSIFEAHDSGVDVEDPSHMLVIIQDDELSAYVNGELVVEEWGLDLTAGDDELFAGFLSDLGCTMTNVWAYSFE